MVNKVYEKICFYIKENYKSLLVFISIILIFTIKLPYYVSAPGGLINTEEKISYSSDFKMKGSLNMAYVSETNGTIPILIYAYFNPTWDIEKNEEIVADNETLEESEYRSKLLLEEANDTSLIVAYEYSNIDYKIENNKEYVTYVDKSAKTDLKIKDQIIKIDGTKVNQKQDLYDYIQTKKKGDKIVFTVIRDNKEIEAHATLIKGPKVGIIVTEDADVKSNYNVGIKFKSSESGSSGGLMMSLSIYSYLNSIDLTKGNTIAGTGTIDKDGNVGSISGVKYKIIGAVNENADVFLVPYGENYIEAKKVKKEENLNIKIVPIETFDDALKYLTK